jgi:hypothetical protein
MATPCLVESEQYLSHQWYMTFWGGPYAVVLDKDGKFASMHFEPNDYFMVANGLEHHLDMILRNGGSLVKDKRTGTGRAMARDGKGPDDLRMYAPDECSGLLPKAVVESIDAERGELDVAYKTDGFKTRYRLKLEASSRIMSGHEVITLSELKQGDAVDVLFYIDDYFPGKVQNTWDVMSSKGRITRKTFVEGDRSLTLGPVVSSKGIPLITEYGNSLRPLCKYHHHRFVVDNDTRPVAELRPFAILHDKTNERLHSEDVAHLIGTVERVDVQKGRLTVKRLMKAKGEYKGMNYYRNSPGAGGLHGQGTRWDLIAQWADNRDGDGLYEFAIDEYVTFVHNGLFDGTRLEDLKQGDFLGVTYYVEQHANRREGKPIHPQFIRLSRPGGMVFQPGPVITYPAAGAALVAGQKVTAEGVGQDLEWRICQKEANGNVVQLTSGKGVRCRFMVPYRAAEDDQIVIELKSPSGSVSQTNCIMKEDS